MDNEYTEFDHYDDDTGHTSYVPDGTIPEGVDAIAIPMRVLADCRLSPSQKLVFGLVAAGITASHVSMAAVLGLTPLTVSKATRVLTKLGYLTSAKYRVAE